MYFQDISSDSKHDTIHDQTFRTQTISVTNLRGGREHEHPGQQQHRSDQVGQHVEALRSTNFHRQLSGVCVERHLQTQRQNQQHNSTLKTEDMHTHKIFTSSRPHLSRNDVLLTLWSATPKNEIPVYKAWVRALSWCPSATSQTVKGMVRHAMKRNNTECNPTCLGRIRCSAIFAMRSSLSKSKRQITAMTKNAAPLVYKKAQRQNM